MPQSTIIHNWRNGFYFCSKHLTFSGGKCHEPYMNTRRIMIIVYYNNKAWKTCTSKLVCLHSFLVPFKQSMCCIAFAVSSVSSPARWTRGKKSTFGHLVLTFRRLESPSRNTVVSRRQLSIHGDVSIGREHFRGIHTPRFQKPRGDWSFHVSRGLLTAQGVALTERLPGGERSTSN